MVKLPLCNKVLQGWAPRTKAKEVLWEVDGRTRCSHGAGAWREAIPLQGTGMTEKFREHSPA